MYYITKEQINNIITTQQESCISTLTVLLKQTLSNITDADDFASKLTETLNNSVSNISFENPLYEDLYGMDENDNLCTVDGETITEKMLVMKLPKKLRFKVESVSFLDTSIIVYLYIKYGNKEMNTDKKVYITLDYLSPNGLDNLYTVYKDTIKDYLFWYLMQYNIELLNDIFKHMQGYYGIKIIPQFQICINDSYFCYDILEDSVFFNIQINKTDVFFGLLPTILDGNTLSDIVVNDLQTYHTPIQFLLCLPSWLDALVGCKDSLLKILRTIYRTNTQLELKRDIKLFVLEQIDGTPCGHLYTKTSEGNKDIIPLFDMEYGLYVDRKEH